MRATSAEACSSVTPSFSLATPRQPVDGTNGKPSFMTSAVTIATGSCVKRKSGGSTPMISLAPPPTTSVGRAALSVGFGECAAEQRLDAESGQQLVRAGERRHLFRVAASRDAGRAL